MEEKGKVKISGKARAESKSKAVSQVARRGVISLLILTLTIITAVRWRNEPVHAQVKPGAQVLLESKISQVANQKVGIITNPTGILPNFSHVVDAYHTDKRIELVAVFGPEHGFRGNAQAGAREVDFFRDPKSNLPVYELYQKTPVQIGQIFEQAGVDIVLFDIQDVGARFYTYIWTLLDALEGAALSGVKFMVLDRPNPIGGVQVSGPVLDPQFSSFIGRLSIPLIHGMTIGELALLFNAEFLPDRIGRKANLVVIPMEGWQRTMYYEDTGLPWVMPSPNIPTVDTALVYPGTCLFEGTNLSEGRGTTRPFELIGADYLDYRLVESLQRYELPGVEFREAFFQPTFNKFANKTISGVQLYVTDRLRFDPILTALVMISEVRRLYPKDFQWRSDNFIDLLAGGSRLRKAIDTNLTPKEIVGQWQRELVDFKKLRSKYLLYK